MDDISFSKKANISVINRFDQQVKDIVISASQVALYVFDAKKTKWIKRKVEGACFFYKRKTSPKYGIFILNRLDTTNFIELMNSTMDIQLQEPFVLYRNIFKTIYGIWFYDITECTAMAAVFQTILKELKEKEQQEQDEDGDTKLHLTDKLDQYYVENDIPEKDRKPSGQPESVRQFFAKASKEATKNQPSSTPQQPSYSKSLCSSFQSVACIEKEQKSNNIESAPFSKSSLDVPEKNYNNDVTLRMTCKEVEPCNVKLAGNLAVIQNNMKRINITNKQNSLNYIEGVDHKFAQPSMIQENSSFPELISPHMLITPSDLVTASIKSESNEVKPKNELSKDQMVEAMQYLLKNDSQFVDKLFEAYLKTSNKTN